jgi:F0F1-type ATP synthase membrane subunit b/b'
MNELIQEALREITEEPWIFVTEIAQFLLLVLIILLLLPRIVGMTLNQRRMRIADKVEKANHADTAYANAQQQAAALLSAARTEAQKTVEVARAAAQDERQSGLDQVDQEAEAILLQARQTVETEQDRVISDASEQLVTLITLVTRRYIEESLTESERRAVTQKLILASLNEIEDTASR